MLKTHNCGELQAKHIGQEVTLAGWLNRRRDHGGLVFIDLRDRSGVVQVVANPNAAPEAHAAAQEARGEYVLQVKGTVRARPEGLVNPDISTGEVEVLAQEVKILNRAKTPPFTSTTTAPWTRHCGSSTATWTCGGRGCRAT